MIKFIRTRSIPLHSLTGSIYRIVTVPVEKSAIPSTMRRLAQTLDILGKPLLSLESLWYPKSPENPECKKEIINMIKFTVTMVHFILNRLHLSDSDLLCLREKSAILIHWCDILPIIPLS
ncbi:hypothetical protein AVEN_177480-1 [Araneus ventricosus]|uniref:Uncharacterized protein n=1 Tax=Araneus ventricosus TaxID=182803 RepID=A0A4Y2D0H6_ARAVE|nr:hypothetical protein AVEN_177480-1 [Araneus ventricosus]